MHVYETLAAGLCLNVLVGVWLLALGCLEPSEKDQGHEA